MTSTALTDTAKTPAATTSSPPRTRRRIARAAVTPPTADVPPHLREIAAALPLMCRLCDLEAATSQSERTWRRRVALGEVRAVSGSAIQSHVLVPRSEVIRYLAEHSR